MITLDHLNPTNETKGLLLEHMEFDWMIDEAMTAWDIIYEWDTK